MLDKEDISEYMRELARKSNEAQKKKLGKDYKAEMVRRGKLRWEKKKEQK